MWPASMKEWTSGLPANPGSTLLLLFVVLAGLSGVSQAADLEASDQGESLKTLTVSGTATVNATPDIAYITVGVVTEHTDARVAQQRNAEQMGRIVEQIKNAGIRPEDIKTLSFTIHPRHRYDRENRESSLEGYTVNNSVQVTVRDLSKAGDIVDMASRYGMNISGGIRFALSDYEAHYRKALSEAGTVAQGRAKVLAESLGVLLKGPVSVSEQSRYEPSPMPIRTMVEAQTTPVESGTVTVQATVNVTYEF